jgi:hypothetical protein
MQATRLPAKMGQFDIGGLTLDEVDNRSVDGADPP